MDISVHHEMRIALGSGIGNAVQHLLLTPHSNGVQTVRQWRIEVPGMEKAVSFADAYGNTAHLVNQVKPQDDIAITVSGLVTTRDGSGVIGHDPKGVVPNLFRRVTPLTRANVTLYGKFRNAEASGTSRVDILHALMARIGEILETEEEARDAEDFPAGTLAERMSHMFVGAARALDIPARYVTGYLYDPDKGESGLHAWAEAYDPLLGWTGFDVMLQLCPTDRHIRLAAGLDALSTLPVRCVPGHVEIAHHAIEIQAGMYQEQQ